MSGEVYEATNAECPSPRCDALVVRVITPVKSGGMTVRELSRYICPNGTSHVPFGWNPDLSAPSQ